MAQKIFKPMRIESSQNARFKAAMNLNKKKYRDRQGEFLLEGLRSAEMFSSSCGAGLIEPRACFYTKEILAAKPETSELLAALHCPLYELPPDLLARLSDTPSPQGIVLAAAKQPTALSDLAKLPGRNKCFLVLDRVQDPGNLGTMIRTADAMGIDGVICLAGTADVYSPKTVRSTMGSLLALPIACGVSEQELLDFLKQENLKLCATALDEAAVKPWQADLQSGCAVVMGNEANGASSLLLASADEKIYIPILGSAESLNVASACSMILYERMRKVFDIK